MKTELFTHGYDNQNEDYCIVTKQNGGTIVVMADGMGGLSLGKEAAQCVCDSIRDYLGKNIDAEDMWQKAFTYADKELRQLSLAYHSNMGAAVTAMMLFNDHFEVAWQGNVRLYISSNNELLQITTDHVMNDGYGHKLLTRCLKGCGLRDNVPHIISPLQEGDTLYLCTDGFYDVLATETAYGKFPSVPDEGRFNDDATCLTIKY
ncbi:MAG: protein phosphatase 2C domain-containing protein [Bacteroidales bacterium]|nr:protein phosphatase 2C domain-containing protein [Bacteroidales bacterium]